MKLSKNQFSLLAIIIDKPNITMGMLSLLSHKSNSHCTRIVDILVKLKLVKRKRIPHRDRRDVSLSVTPLGGKVYKNYKVYYLVDIELFSENESVTYSYIQEAHTDSQVIEKFMQFNDEEYEYNPFGEFEYETNCGNIHKYKSATILNKNEYKILSKHFPVWRI